MFGECGFHAKLPVSNKVMIPKGGSQWFSGVYLGKDTEADEVILPVGNANGVFKTSRSALSSESRLLSNGMRLE